MNIWHAQASFWGAGNSFRFSSNFLFTCHEGASVDSLASSKSPYLFNTCCKTTSHVFCRHPRRTLQEPWKNQRMYQLSQTCTHLVSYTCTLRQKKLSLSLDILLNLAFQSFHKPSGPWDLQGWERSYDWGINLELLIAKLSLGEHSPALWIFDDFWITSTVTQPIPRDRHPNILSLLPQILKFLWWDWLKLNGSNMFKRIIPNTWMLHDASINILSKIKYGQIHSNTKHDTSVHGYPNFDHHHPSRRNNAFCPATCCSDLGWAGLKSMAHWKIHTICRQELTGTDRNHIWDWHFKESLTKAPPWTTWQIFSWLVNSRGICASRYK